MAAITRNIGLLEYKCSLKTVNHEKFLTIRTGDKKFKCCLSNTPTDLKVTLAGEKAIRLFCNCILKELPDEELMKTSIDRLHAHLLETGQLPPVPVLPAAETGPLTPVDSEPATAPLTPVDSRPASESPTPVEQQPASAPLTPVVDPQLAEKPVDPKLPVTTLKSRNLTRIFVGTVLVVGVVSFIALRRFPNLWQPSVQDVQAKLAQVGTRFGNWISKTLARA